MAREIRIYAGKLRKTKIRVPELTHNQGILEEKKMVCAVGIEAGTSVMIPIT